jgi:hypothetical protein
MFIFNIYKNICHPGTREGKDKKKDCFFETRTKSEKKTVFDN